MMNKTGSQKSTSILFLLFNRNVLRMLNNARDSRRKVTLVEGALIGHHRGMRCFICKEECDYGLEYGNARKWLCEKHFELCRWVLKKLKIKYQVA